MARNEFTVLIETVTQPALAFVFVAAAATL